MDKEIKLFHKYLKHHKIAIYSIVAFLFLITGLLIVVAKQISNEQALQMSSEGYYAAFPGAPEYENETGGAMMEQEPMMDTYMDTQQGEETTTETIPGQACFSTYESYVFNPDRPGSNTGTCQATYRCNSSCGCAMNDPVTVQCRGSYSPLDPQRRVQCQWQECEEQAVKACEACTQLRPTKVPLTPPAPPEATLEPTIEPTEEVSCINKVIVKYQRCSIFQEKNCVPCPDDPKQKCKVTDPDTYMYYSRIGTYYQCDAKSPMKGPVSICSYDDTLDYCRFRIASRFCGC